MTPELSSSVGGASVVLAYLLPLATAGLSAVRRWAHSRSARKQADAALSAADAESATLDVGDTVLHGRVEYAKGEDRAVAMHVEQAGSEAESSGSWTVTWRETARSVDVKPFYVVHASGERVRVEPTGETKIAAELTHVTRRDKAHRTRTASITPNTDVWITGELTKDQDPENAGGGYRGARGWVMRPPLGRREPMWVSIQSPDTRLRKEASRSRRWMVVFGVVFIAMMLAHASYHVLFWSGHPATAHVTGKHTETDSDGDVSSFVLDVHVTGLAGTTRAKESLDGAWDVTHDDYDRIKGGETFPAIASFGWPATSQPGDRPVVTIQSTIVSMLAWLVLAIIARVGDRAKVWYDGVPVVDSVSGRLEE
jgi:hypothetical protein